MLHLNKRRSADGVQSPPRPKRVQVVPCEWIVSRAASPRGAQTREEARLASHEIGRLYENEVVRALRERHLGCLVYP